MNESSPQQDAVDAAAGAAHECKAAPVSRDARAPRDATAPRPKYRTRRQQCAAAQRGVTVPEFQLMDAKAV